MENLNPNMNAEVIPDPTRQMKAANGTKYPKLFNNYWGGFVLSDNPMITNEILQNRNTFVEEFKLKNPPSIPGYVGEERVGHGGDRNRTHNPSADHFEVYQNNEKDYVCIYSPYKYDPVFQKKNFNLCSIDYLKSELTKHSLNIEGLTQKDELINLLVENKLSRDPVFKGVGWSPYLQLYCDRALTFVKVITMKSKTKREPKVKYAKCKERFAAKYLPRGKQF